MNGVIARIVGGRGFGFITGEDGVDRFFHISSVARGGSFDELSEGQKVTFIEDRNSNDKGPRAALVAPA